jgi:putative CocE/NonD family hydrolase
LALSACGDSPWTPQPAGNAYVPTRKTVPDPKDIFFETETPATGPIRLAGHYWYHRVAVAEGKRLPAVVELNPYRRRDGTMRGDSAWYPYFAYCGYLVFRVDLQGSGDSEGILTDEYTDEEIACCIQVIEQIAAHPQCDGNVGMLGTSWSAINSLMVAAHDKCPPQLKGVLVMCGNDDRFNDDVHYKGGAMMQDNIGWASSMWGWLTQPPDPLVVGENWQEMWRQRIRNAEFWFDRWARHQKRDEYWTRNSVRDRFDKVKVPVYILSGWQDGYKNPVPRVVSGLAAAGKTASGMIGPWGHSTPDAGYPGPRMNWLPYMMTHLWDHWLKGKDQDPKTTLPQLTVWLGESREPGASADFDEAGHWVAEDAGWEKRVVAHPLYLRPDGSMAADAPTEEASIDWSPRVIVNANQLETSSFGQSGNDDLPGDQQAADARSLRFTGEPLTEDMACFGQPSVTLTLACDKPIASLVVRLSEVSPTSGAAHQVSYTFYNLCQQDGTMANPVRIDPDRPFTVQVPLDVIGHTFRRGWRLQLAVAPSTFPTLWHSPELPAITLFTGTGPAVSRLVMPLRTPRSEDAKLAARIPSAKDIISVNADEYLPMTTRREGSERRYVMPFVATDGRQGTEVNKIFDSGCYGYGGPLDNLWVDQVAEENFRIIDGDPLSQRAETSFKLRMERPTAGWRVRAETSAVVWSEKTSEGGYVFNYTASIETFTGSDDTPFEQKVVNGTIPREWL